MRDYMTTADGTWRRSRTASSWGKLVPALWENNNGSAARIVVAISIINPIERIFPTNNLEEFGINP